MRPSDLGRLVIVLTGAIGFAAIVAETISGRRRRRHETTATPDEEAGVVRLPSADTRQALDRIARRFVYPDRPR